MTYYFFYSFPPLFLLSCLKNWFCPVCSLKHIGLELEHFIYLRIEIKDGTVVQTGLRMNTPSSLISNVNNVSIKYKFGSVYIKNLLDHPFN